MDGTEIDQPVDGAIRNQETKVTNGVQRLGEDASFLPSPLSLDTLGAARPENIRGKGLECGVGRGWGMEGEGEGRGEEGHGGSTHAPERDHTHAHTPTPSIALSLPCPFHICLSLTDCVYVYACV